ncbi:MAG: hypothetical protein QM639_00835 [Rhodocyclaceae bacterium]
MRTLYAMFHVTLKATIMRSTDIRETLALEPGERRFLQARAGTLVLAQAGNLTLTRPLASVADTLQPVCVRLNGGEAYGVDEEGWICLEAARGMADVLIVTPADHRIGALVWQLARQLWSRWLGRDRKLRNQAAA